MHKYKDSGKQAIIILIDTLKYYINSYNKNYIFS